MILWRGFRLRGCFLDHPLPLVVEVLFFFRGWKDACASCENNSKSTRNRELPRIRRLFGDPTKTCRFLIVKVARVAEKGHLLVWKHLFEELLSLGSVLSWFPSKLAARNHRLHTLALAADQKPISGVRKPPWIGHGKMTNRRADEGLCTPLGLLLPTSSTHMLGKRSRWNLGDFLRTLASHFGHLVV